MVEAQGEKNFALKKWDIEQWTLYVDGALNNTRSVADIMLINLEGHKIHCGLHFGFRALNNEAEYEALIAALHVAREPQAHNIQIYDSKLMVN